MVVSIPEALCIAKSFRKSSKFREAQSVLRQILKDDPNHLETLHLLGLTHLETQEPDRAVSFFEKACAIDPTCIQFQNSLGFSLISLGKIKEAETVFNKTIQELSNQEDASKDLSKTYVITLELLSNQGKLDQAIEHGRKALKIDPKNQNAHFHMGNLLFRLQMWNESIFHYQCCVELQPENFDARFNLGVVFNKLDRFDLSVEAFQSALLCNPGHVETLYNLAANLLALEKCDQAEELLHRALKIEPHCFQANLCMGRVLEIQGHFQKAIAFYALAAKEKPNDPIPYWHMGVALRNMGKLVEALKSLNQALKFDPSFIPAQQISTELSAQLKDLQS